MDLGRIQEIRQRISEIQQQIGLSPKVPGMDFSSRLQQEMNKMKSRVERVAAMPETGSAEGRGNAAEGVQATSGGRDATPAGTGTISALVAQAAKKYDVDPRLVSAVAEVESNNNPAAVSGAGAIGVMQLMPDTAAALGVDPYDAEQNIEGGTRYLRQMLDSFGGDVRKALAAYNAGPQAVRDYNGVPPYSETQDYVNRVLDIYR